MASSSDDELLLDHSSAKLVALTDTTMTLEVVVPAGTKRGERIGIETEFGPVNVTVPLGLMGRKFCVVVDVDSTTPQPTRSTNGSERSHRGSSMGGSSDDGPEDEDGHSSPSKQDSFSSKIVAVDDAKVTIEVVVPVGMQPGERIWFKTPVGMPDGMAGMLLHAKNPSNLGPGRKFHVNVPRPAATPPAPARPTDGSGSSHGSEYAGQVIGEVIACVNELCRWQRTDGPAGSQEARAKLLKQLSELVASDEQLFGASTDARAHTVLGYLEMFQQLRTADWEPAQMILTALQTEGLSPDRASPLQAIQGLLVVVNDGTKAHGCHGNFVGLDIDSGR